MKVLFFSPHALLDSSSGAAQSVSALLSEVVDLGHHCVAVTGSLADQDNQRMGKVRALDPVDVIEAPSLEISTPVRKVTVHGVTHYVAFFESSNIKDLRALEETSLKELYLRIFAQFEPDVVLTYGGLSSNLLAGLYAQSQGCCSVLYAGSPTYTKAHHFVHVDKVITNSNAMRDQMTPVTDKPITALSPLIRIPDVVCETRTPEFITFINPMPEKGLALVAALAEMCQAQNKPYKFLFVEGRCKKNAVYERYPALRGLGTVLFADNTDNIKLVYEHTSVVLFPSIWFEAAGRVAIEANANGIPVLANRVGGVPEVLDGAGYLFDPPPEMRENFSAAPPPSYVSQWLDVIDRLHNDPAEMADAEVRAKAAAERYSLRAHAQTFIAAVSAPKTN